MPDAPQQVVFAHSAESLFHRALKGDVTAALEAQLREVGLDLGKPLLPAYPVPLWNRVLEVTARAVYPNDEPAVAARRLGERMIAGYSLTLIGKAVVAMAKVIGPRRALLRTRQNWRSGNNYTEVELTELGPGDFRAVMNESGISRWVTQGLHAAGLVMAGAKEASVEVESFNDTHTTYRLTWR